MTDAAQTEPTKTPWHLWLVGALLTLWNGAGVVDFTATVTHFEPYMGQFPQGMKDALYASPLWMFVVWGVGVWGGLLGAILLLLRKALAAPAWAASLAGATASLVAGFLQPPPGGYEPTFPLIIVSVAAISLLYTVWMIRRGVLR